MLVNFTNDSASPSVSSFSSYEIKCSKSTIGQYVVTAISFTYILFILPLSVFVLFLGFQRWRQQRSVSSAATMAHSDFFTYNMAVIELIGVFGCAFYYLSSYADFPVMSSVRGSVGSFASPGQTLFPVVTCVERYLAVVHPITYRGLRQAGGVRIRNIITGCIWLTCFVWVGFVIAVHICISLYNRYFTYALVAIGLIFFLIVMVFCSLSVLRVLIRPRPGKVGRFNEKVDQSKQRAIRTILIIMGVLWLRFGGNVIAVIINSSTQVNMRCAAEGLIYVFFLPSGLVLPLLFLQRVGKLPNCKHHVGSGPPVHYVNR